jgi:DNA polymerase-3 subunit delta
MVWIQRHFLALGKRIEPKLCQYLLEITDGTMTSLGSEIKKIASYSGADTICRADIDAVTEPVLDAVVFRMTDQLSAGDYGAALITLQKLMKLQEEPLQILGAIGGHFRRISAAKTLLEHGRNAQELQKLCGIADFAARKAMEAARRCNQEYLQKAAELVVETDHKMKTSYDDPARLLELLILQLAMEGRHG